MCTAERQLQGKNVLVSLLSWRRYGATRGWGTGRCRRSGWSGCSWWSCGSCGSGGTLTSLCSGRSLCSGKSSGSKDRRRVRFYSVRDCWKGWIRRGCGRTATTSRHAIWGTSWITAKSTGEGSTLCCNNKDFILLKNIFFADVYSRWHLETLKKRLPFIFQGLQLKVNI